MNTTARRRRDADLLVVMRRTLIRRTIAEAAGDDVAFARQTGILDGLACGLPFRLQTEHALHRYVGYPARRTIERYGILALRENNGDRPW